MSDPNIGKGLEVKTKKPAQDQLVIIVT